MALRVVMVSYCSTSCCRALKTVRSSHLDGVAVADLEALEVEVSRMVDFLPRKTLANLSDLRSYCSICTEIAESNLYLQVC